MTAGGPQLRATPEPRLRCGGSASVSSSVIAWLIGLVVRSPLASRMTMSTWPFGDSSPAWGSGAPRWSLADLRIRRGAPR